MKFVDRLVFNLPKTARQSLWDAYLFNNAIHVDRGEFKTQDRTTFSAMNPPLGVTHSFYNCIGVYINARHKDESWNPCQIKEGLIHFNEESNSKDALNAMQYYIADLSDKGWLVKGLLIRNLVCSSDQTGAITRMKQQEAKEYVEGKIKGLPFDYKDTWVGESGFIVKADGTVIEKSVLKNTFLNHLSPVTLEALRKEFAPSVVETATLPEQAEEEVTLAIRLCGQKIQGNLRS